MGKLFHHHISKIGGKKAFYVNADQLSDSLVYIHKNYHQNITLEELAEYAHLSEGQFCRSFKELTGMTPVSLFDTISYPAKLQSIAFDRQKSNRNRSFLWIQQYQLLQSGIF